MKGDFSSFMKAVNGPLKIDFNNQIKAIKQKEKDRLESFKQEINDMRGHAEMSRFV